MELYSSTDETERPNARVVPECCGVGIDGIEVLPALRFT